MRQIREILRQKWALGLSHRAVAQSLGVGLGTISSVVTRAQGAGLDWPQVQPLSDDAWEGRLYGRPEVAGQRQRPAPDCAWIHAERRRPGVTLALLHLEYLERYPDGYRYRRFCDLYRRWLGRRRLSMRQVHRAGDKCFVKAIDYPARRELDKAVIRQLATCRWIDEHQQVLVTGATGTGKSFIACALAHQASRRGFRAYYRRASRLFDDLRLARADGTYGRLLGKLARMDVLLLDDWGLAPRNSASCPGSRLETGASHRANSATG
ncbi:MAG: hypothetical protein A2X53_19010 [Candidatus Rokubacteria bacterium GWA2_70_23]|nr:MAG: hypothetical protein A2X53_19010 [Candidatus Rokubacteria bacterium GWA2_70_23]